MNSRIFSNPFLIFLCRLVVGSVFIVAAIDKIVAPDAFAESIYAYGLIPYPLINLFALILPWLELCCGILLISGVFVRSSASILTLLLLIFIVAIITALSRHLNIDCGCFGKDHATPVSWEKVLEDAGLMILGLMAVLTDSVAIGVQTFFVRHGTTEKPPR
ncbi:MAG TPA: MauE/DoxX family redox-associated membrane protein [Bacteroidota bacterium]|nr:MauE/DoxX family redox-associated membrane protein [Bacteroidota bacterium]